MRRVRFLFVVMIAALTLSLSACNGFNFFQAPDDKAIIADIQAKLFQDPVFKTQDIRVESQKGVVVLSGSVGTELEKSAVERLAGQSSGVKQVINQLAVSAPATAAAPAEVPSAEPAPAKSPKARSARAVRAAPPPERANAAAPPARAKTEEENAAEAPRQAASATPAATATPPPPRQPDHVAVPSGTVVTVRMIDSVDSERNRPGEEFAASLDAPIVVGERVVMPRGSDARVRLVEARSAGRLAGSSVLELELISLTANGNLYSVQSGYYTLRGASRGKRTAETVGGGAGLGALIGAIAGKGKGAAIGAAIGAGAGTAAQAATHGQQVKVPSETKLDFTLKAPVNITF